MKKYNQLLLLIISIVSLTLFLIYRHEYNRLHYVLEVFNFFGQPCSNTTLESTDTILNHHDWGPQPVWQELENGYVYSAFLTSQNEAKALTVLSDEKLVPRNCYLWFEDRKKTIVGKFKFSKITNDENSRSNLYFYICTSGDKVNEHIPYAVSFSYKTKKENELKKVMLTNSFTSHRQININATICVAPSVYSKKRLIEFLSYHKLIGIDSFIFYNRDVPHRLVKIITNLSTRLGFQISFLQWNFPKPETPMTRIIVENDCLLRTFGHNFYVTTLELNEYIVPSRGFSFNQMVKNLVLNSDRISLPVQKFCISNTESTKPISVANIDVSEDYNFNVVRYVHKNGQSKDEISTSAVEKEFASIHKYVRCAIQPVQTHQDTSILKFSTDLIRSTLFQLFLHNQI